MRLLVALVGLSCVFVACGLNDDLIASDTSLQPPPSTTSGGGGSSSSGGAATGSSSGGAAVGDGGSSGRPDSGPPPAPRCNPADAPGPSAPVPGLPPGAQSPTFSGDELQAFFLHVSGSAYNVYQATRADRAAPFGAAVDLGLTSFFPPYGGVTISDDALSLYYTQFNESVSLMVATRATAAAAFGAPTVFHPSAYMDVTARDGSARFFSTFAADTMLLYGLRPAAADLASATPLVGNALVSWYEAPSGTLWFTQYVQTEDSLVYLPQSQHWNGATWDAAVAADLLVSWTSPDDCRLYGNDGTAVVVRSRPLPP